MNNTDNSMITSMLSTALIVMIFVLFILFIVYIVLKLKQIQNKKQPAKDVKMGSNLEPKVKNKSKINNFSKASIMDFMEFDDIQDNMIVQKNGKRFLMVVECQGVNYDLMSALEKNAVEEGFQQFLNTLRHPIQIYIQTRTVNLEKSISTYNKTVGEIEEKLNRMKFEYDRMLETRAYTKEQLEKYRYNLTKQKNLYEYAKDIVYNTEKMSLNKNILNKQYYVVIPYYSEEASEDKYSKEEIVNMAFAELYTKAQAIVRVLSACSVAGKILTSYELLDLLYFSYNRDEAELYGTEKAFKAGFDELYSTGRDVFEQKVKILDKEIENRAIDLVNEKVRKVKSTLQENAEEKENNMDDLINEMAQILVDENERYLGKDVANIVKEEIKQEKERKEEKKGGKKNVQEKTTTSRKRKSV